MFITAAADARRVPCRGNTNRFYVQIAAKRFREKAQIKNDAARVLIRKKKRTSKGYVKRNEMKGKIENLFHVLVLISIRVENQFSRGIGANAVNHVQQKTLD